MSSFLPILSPGVPFSTMNAETPLAPASLFVKQKKITISLIKKIESGIERKLFINTLQNDIYSELDKIA